MESVLGKQHDLSEVIQGLIGNGLIISSFYEYDTSPYDCFQDMLELPGGFQIKGMEGKLPWYMP